MTAADPDRGHPDLQPEDGPFRARAGRRCRAQTAAAALWDLLVVDNNSNPPLADRIDVSWHPRGTILVEPTQGRCTRFARPSGATSTDCVMFLDDDTVATARPDRADAANR